jgi:hypothetical protein
MVWLKLKHTSIVPLLGTANVESPFPALVSPWMHSGTLYMYLKQAAITVSAKVELVSPLFTTIAFTKRSLISYRKIAGVADGLKYRSSTSITVSFFFDVHPVHSENVVHGDLHPVCTVESM